MNTKQIGVIVFSILLSACSDIVNSFRTFLRRDLMDRHLVGRVALVAGAFATLALGFNYSTQIYSGSWLGMMPPELADVLGSFVAIGVLPVGLGYLLLPALCRSAGEALQWGLVVVTLSAVMCPLTAYLRVVGPYPNPVPTVAQHALAVFVVSFVLLLVLGVIPTAVRAYFARATSETS